MNDDFLNRYRRAPRPEFAARLYERMAGPMTTQPKRPAGRMAWLTAATMLASVSFAMLLFPPARAFADGIWHQIGAYVLVQTPPDPNGKVKQKQEDVKAAAAGTMAPADATKVAAANKNSPNQPEKPSAATAAEAGQLAGFSVLAPSYLADGYVPGAGWMVAHESEGVSVMTFFQGAGHHAMKLVEFKLAAGHAPVPLYWPNAQAVTVRGLPAYMLADETGSGQSLIWEENGITISLMGEGLTQAEFIQVAEGMH
jgi:hypothetical protein